MLVSASHSVIRYGGGHVSSRFGREEYVEAWFDPFNKKDWENYLEGYLDGVLKAL